MQTLSPDNLPQIESEGCNSISIYRGELSQEAVAKSVARIKAAFPVLTPGFYVVLIDRMKEKGFSDERLKDSVNNVIDNCFYPTPSIANFLSFDSRVKIISYQELMNIVGDQRDSWSNYSRIRIKGKGFFVKKVDKMLYSIPDEI